MNEFKNWLPWNLADISVKFLLVFCQFPPSFWTVHEGNRWVSKDHRNHGFCGQTPCFSQIWDSTSWFFKEVREFHVFVGSYPHPMLAAYHHVVLSKLGDTNTPCMAIWMGKGNCASLRHSQTNSYHIFGYIPRSTRETPMISLLVAGCFCYFRQTLDWKLTPPN